MKKSVTVNQSGDAPALQKPHLRVFEKLKSIKFGKSNDNKKVSKLFGGFGNKLKTKLTSKLGKASIKGEEILGVEITAKEIRLAQVASNKANQWILEKLYIHKVDLPEDSAVLDNADKLGEELAIALQKSKITTPNAAIAIPVTSAIIRVVTSPLMNDEELKKQLKLIHFGKI